MLSDADPVIFAVGSRDFCISAMPRVGTAVLESQTASPNSLFSFTRHLRSHVRISKKIRVCGDLTEGWREGAVR